MPSDVEEALGRVFRRPELLRQALTHRSFAAEHNERLEFIGDGVLNCAIALMLYERFPQMSEGELSRINLYPGPDIFEPEPKRTFRHAGDLDPLQKASGTEEEEAGVAT